MYFYYFYTRLSSHKYFFSTLNDDHIQCWTVEFQLQFRLRLSSFFYYWAISWGQRAERIGGGITTTQQQTLSLSVCWMLIMVSLFLIPVCVCVCMCVRTGSALALLYGTSATLEHHHFNHAVMILQSEVHYVPISAAMQLPWRFC